LFLPGIASLEFLNNENTALVYLDPNNGNLPVGQVRTLAPPEWLAGSVAATATRRRAAVCPWRCSSCDAGS
jgi:hypothetical protein